MADTFNMDQMRDLMTPPFPAKTKQAARTIAGTLTDVMTVSFSDKIMVVITQNGRLAQWLHVPLENANPAAEDGYHTIQESADDSILLPMPGLTATSILGGRAPEHETIGQLYATQIGSAIVTKNPNEKRLLVVGLGLDKLEADRDIFFSVVDLVLECL